MFNSNMVDHRKWWLNDDRYLTPETQARLMEMQAAEEIRDEEKGKNKDVNKTIF